MILDLLKHEYEAARELYADIWLGFSQVELGRMLSAAGFEGTEVAIVDREDAPPYFQTVLAVAVKPV